MSLTPEQQCVRLAEFEGWKHDGYWTRPDGMQFANGIDCLPNYLDPLTGLSHLHRVEGLLTDEQKADVIDWLFHNLPEEENHGPHPEVEGDIMTVGLWQIFHATATQRLEALVRTLFPEEMR